MSALSLIGASARLQKRTALDGVDLTVAAGELVALVGSNGAGKSSAIRALAGLLPISHGRAELAGRDVRGLSPTARASAVAYLPQERRIAWNMPAVEIAALGAPLASPAEALVRARAALAEVDALHLVDRGVAEMSGGERARVLLARALAADSGALMVDEPVAGLDPDAQLLVLERLKARAQAGQAVLVSLHDLTLAARHADRVVVLKAGRVAAEGPPLEALSPPILADVFGLAGRWIDDGGAPLLAAARAR